MGLAAETENTDCKRTWGDFAYGSSANKKIYFDNDWATGCQVVDWETAYSIFERDSYKRCVCDSHLGGEVSENCQ